MINYQLAREEMVELIERKGVRDPRVLEALRETKRHLFVPANLRARAYEDTPLQIGEGQTISQPLMVARMTELLEVKEDHKVLEIGTGSGYQTALLASLAKKVCTVERIAPLARRAKEIFDKHRLDNIVQKVGDGSLGWAQFAPYDRIIVTAAAPELPERLAEQLKPDGGMLLVPVGPRRVQELWRVVRHGDERELQRHGGCVFVPLIGSDGWEEGVE